MNPTQQAAGQAKINAAQAFGMAPQNLTAYSSLPQTETIGGVTGYTSAPLYTEAVAAGGRADPTQQQIYDSLFGNDKGYS